LELGIGYTTFAENNQATRSKHITMSSSKYIQVIEDIHKELMTCELSENIGLHSGTPGIALFLAYYDRIIKQKMG